MERIVRLRAGLARLLHEPEGQGLAEYALILALIAIIAIVALIFLGGQISKSSRASETRCDGGRDGRRPRVTCPTIGRR